MPFAQRLLRHNATCLRFPGRVQMAWSHVIWTDVRLRQATSTRSHAMSTDVRSRVAASVVAYVISTGVWWRQAASVVTHVISTGVWLLQAAIRSGEISQPLWRRFLDSASLHSK